MYLSMLDTLAKIHSVDVDLAGLGDYGVRVGKGKEPGPNSGVAGTGHRRDCYCAWYHSVI